MKWAFAGTLALIAVLILSLYIYVGGYKPVLTEIGDQDSLKIVYKEHLGPYHEIGPVLNEVERWAHENGEKCARTFGEFLDNPKIVAEDRLRSHAGCVVEKPWVGGLSTGLMFREIPRRLYLTAVFEGAPSIGPLKVYPKADAIMTKEGFEPDGAVIETYEILSEKSVRTRYYFPIKKSDSAH